MQDKLKGVRGNNLKKNFETQTMTIEQVSQVNRFSFKLIVMRRISVPHPSLSIYLYLYYNHIFISVLRKFVQGHCH